MKTQKIINDNLFNLDGMQSFQDSQVVQNDAGIVLSRHLTSVNPNILTAKYPELVFDSLGINVDNTGGYAKQIQTIRLLEQGGFGPEGDNRGIISLAAEDSTVKVSIRETAVRWTQREIQQADIAGINIVDKYMKATVTKFNQELDTSALIGIQDGKSNTNSGLADNTAYTSAVVATSDQFAKLDAKKKYAFIADHITAQHNSVNNTPEYAADKCLLPTSVFNDAANTILNDFSNGSVLAVLIANFPNVTFLQSSKLEAVNSTKRMVLFSSNSDAVAYRLPVPFNLTPIFQMHNDFSTIATYHTAGVEVLEPSSGRIVTGL